jgi:hypothetical protein
MINQTVLAFKLEHTNDLIHRACGAGAIGRIYNWLGAIGSTGQGPAGPGQWGGLSGQRACIAADADAQRRRP